MHTWDVASSSAAIVAWGDVHGRRPPWREIDDPYVLAVAEVLLQKTKAADAEPVWSRVVGDYPTAVDLVDAENDELAAKVRPLGLGRQRVARLKAMAKALIEGEDTLPGIGPYGAGVLALASGRNPTSAPVDGNVARVLSRLLGLSWERGEPRKKAEVRDALKALLAGERALDTLYAVVDLGATVCLPTKPKCRDCPLAEWCATARRG